VKKVTILMVFMMMFGVTAHAGDLNGVVSATAQIDMSDSENDFNVNDPYVALGYGGDNFGMYASYEDTTVVFEEVYVQYPFLNLDWKVGQVIAPFGFDHLQRPETTVFITAPRGSYYRNGLTLQTIGDKMSLEGSYLGANEYTLRGSLALFDGGNTTSLSYANSDFLEAQYGQWALTNKLLYESLMFNTSILAEWMPDTGDVWIRSVLSPGIFDVIGLMVGYYDVADMLYSTDGGTVWSYGAYVDISTTATASVEWNNDKAINPITVRITANF
jgi:hypothetical protein